MTTLQELHTGWHRGLSAREQMQTLCELFPTLRGVPGTAPWDQKRFARWVAGPAPSSAMRQAGLFILGVWNGEAGEEGKRPWWCEDHPGRLDVFDPILALKLWDEPHASAFRAWCNDPFFP